MGLGTADAKVKATVQWEMDQDIDTEMKKVDKSVKKTDKTMEKMTRNTAKDMEKIKKSVKLGMDVFLAGELAGAIKAVFTGLSETAKELDKNSKGANAGAAAFVKLESGFKTFKKNLGDWVLNDIPILSELIGDLADAFDDPMARLTAFSDALAGLTHTQTFRKIDATKDSIKAMRVEYAKYFEILQEGRTDYQKMVGTWLKDTDRMKRIKKDIAEANTQLVILVDLEKKLTKASNIPGQTGPGDPYGPGVTKDKKPGGGGGGGGLTGTTEDSAKQELEFRNSVAEAIAAQNIKHEKANTEAKRNEAAERMVIIRQEEAAEKAAWDADVAALQRHEEIVADLNDQSMKTGVGAMTNAWAGFFEVLASGSGAFDQLAKAALSTLGDLAIQMGTYLFFSGIGLSLIPGFQASAGAIPAGLALMAAGGVMKGLAGGGGGSTATASGGGSQFGGSSFGGGFNPAAPRNDSGGGGDTFINVNIGDTLDGAQNIVRKLFGVANEMGDSGHVRLNRSVFQGA